MTLGLVWSYIFNRSVFRFFDHFQAEVVLQNFRNQNRPFLMEDKHGKNKMNKTNVCLNIHKLFHFKFYLGLVCLQNCNDSTWNSTSCSINLKYGEKNKVLLTFLLQPFLCWINGSVLSVISYNHIYFLTEWQTEWKYCRHKNLAYHIINILL